MLARNTAQVADVCASSNKRLHTTGAEGAAAGAAREADLPGDGEELGRVVTHCQPQPLWIVVLQDVERFHRQGDRRCIAVAISLKIYEPRHLSHSWLNHNSPH